MTGLMKGKVVAPKMHWMFHTMLLKNYLRNFGLSRIAGPGASICFELVMVKGSD